MKDFHKNISEWMNSNGYEEVYSNHPLNKNRIYHFAKDGVRVVFDSEKYKSCYLSTAVFTNPHYLELRTANINVGADNINEIHKYLKDNADKLKK